MRPAVHQLVPVLARGDGVSGSVLRFRDLLRRLGYRSSIFSPLVERRLRSHAKPLDVMSRELGPDDVVMYHLSIGSTLAMEFVNLRSRRVIFYHNITPPESVDRASPVLAHHLRWGRSDLASLAPGVDLGMAPSEFSARELRAAGVRRVAVVPLPPALRRLRPRAAHPGPKVSLLSVGRFAPHKRQDFLIKVLAAIRATRAPDATLTLVGGGDVPSYVGSLMRLAGELHVDDAVRFEAGMDDRALGDTYAQASVYLCASDHEGFCLPLLEAMAFSVPVIGYDAAAVAETVGDGGVVIDDRDPLVWAGVAWRVACDTALHQRLASAGRRRLDDFSDSIILQRLQEAIAWLAADGASAERRPASIAT